MKGLWIEIGSGILVICAIAVMLGLYGHQVIIR